MKKITYIALSLIIGACSKNAETVSENSDTPSANTEDILISTTQLSHLSLDLQDASYTSFAKEITATGMVDVPPENVAKVSAVLNGTIQSMTHNVLPGKYVKKGSILAVAESMELVQLQQDYLEAYLKQELLNQELSRQKELDTQGAGVPRKLQEATSQWKLNKATTDALAAKLQIANVNLNNLKAGKITNKLYIVAPLSGYVKEVMINTGSNFQPGMVLFELISKEHLHVELKVFEKDAPQLKEGQKVNFDINGLKTTGSIFLIAKAFDSASKSINAHVHFDSESAEQQLTPGQTLTGSIQIDAAQVLVIPESAVLREPDGTYVLILKEKTDAGSTFQKTKVEIGSTKNGLCELISPATLKNVVTKNVTLAASIGAASEEE